MARMRRLRVPVLVGLLVAVLLGPAGVTAMGPRTVTASIMIPAAAFIPTSDDEDYQNEGGYLTATTNTARFSAPLTFPMTEVSIRRIALYAYDNDGTTYRVCAKLLRASPSRPDQSEITPEWFCSEDSILDPQVLTTSDISPRTVNTTFHGAYLSVILDAGYSEIRFYGVKVTYTYETAA